MIILMIKSSFILCKGRRIFIIFNNVFLIKVDVIYYVNTDVNEFEFLNINLSNLGSFCCLKKMMGTNRHRKKGMPSIKMSELLVQLLAFLGVFMLLNGTIV